MMTVTRRIRLAREIKTAIGHFQMWLDPAFRNRPEALEKRNEALIIAQRRLTELMDDHTEQVKARLHTAKATGRCPECFVPVGSHHKMDCSQRGGGVVYGADPVPDADGGS